MNKKILYPLLGLLAVLILVGLGWFYHQSVKEVQEAGQASAQSLDAPALDLPADLTYETAQPGQTVSLKTDFKDHITVVNYWASWCSICQEQMPDYVKLYESYRDNPRVSFVFVNLTDGQQETREKAEAYLKSHQYDIPVYYDLGAKNFQALGLRGVPDTFVLNGQGQLAALGQNPGNQQPYYIRPGAMPAQLVRAVIERELAK